jgi:hypothetical protein
MHMWCLDKYLNFPLENNIRISIETSYKTERSLENQKYSDPAQQTTKKLQQNQNDNLRK